MYKILAPLTLALAAAIPLSAQETPVRQPVQLSMEQQTSLRCGVAFGVIAGGQATGNQQALAYPAMEPRGKEFFVRTMARLMDELALNRDQVSQLALTEMESVKKGGAEGLKQLMPACLMLLDASGV